MLYIQLVYKTPFDLFDEILYHMSYISDTDHVCYISKQKEKRSKEMKRG